jgi:carboxyl-terminal processing protease
LKEDKNVDTFYDLLVGYAPSIVDGSDFVMYRTMFDIAYKLDDLHTSHAFPGFYEPPYGIGLSISDLSPNSTAFYNGLWAVQDLLEEKYGSTSNIPEFTLLDDDKIAVIHLQGFDIDTPNEFKAILDGLPTSVDSVVIDLSYNTGGNLGAVLRIFGYMTENPIMYHSQNPADGSAATYYIESDYVAYDYQWYILTSSVTFSAANLMASMAKEQGIATVIGQDSSGGASSIGAIILPDGTGLIISTNNVLSTRVGNEVDGYDYLSIEYGIEVEIEMNDVTSDTELVSVIRSHQQGN